MGHQGQITQFPVEAVHEHGPCNYPDAEGEGLFFSVTWVSWKIISDSDITMSHDHGHGHGHG